jgi:hypothetical protein
MQDPEKRRLYEEGRGLFLQGKYEDAIESFKRIYGEDLLFRDVVEIVHDYYDKERREWVAKYAARFQTSVIGH